MVKLPQDMLIDSGKPTHIIHEQYNTISNKDEVATCTKLRNVGLKWFYGRRKWSCKSYFRKND